MEVELDDGERAEDVLERLKGLVCAKHTPGEAVNEQGKYLLYTPHGEVMDSFDKASDWLKKFEHVCLQCRDKMGFLQENVRTFTAVEKAAEDSGHPAAIAKVAEVKKSCQIKID